jgi:hypothetical protein
LSIILKVQGQIVDFFQASKAGKGKLHYFFATFYKILLQILLQYHRGLELLT